MEEASQPSRAGEPDEAELRELLESRDEQQAARWQDLRRISTRIIGLAVLAGAAAFLATGWNGDPAAADAGGNPQDAATDQPAAVPAIFAGAVDNPDEEALKRAAGMPTKADERAKAMDGKVIDPEDIRFAMDLLQFMQGPPEAAPKAGKSDP